MTRYRSNSIKKKRKSSRPASGSKGRSRKHQNNQNYHYTSSISSTPSDDYSIEGEEKNQAVYQTSPDPRSHKNNKSLYRENGLAATKSPFRRQQPSNRKPDGNENSDSNSDAHCNGNYRNIKKEKIRKRLIKVSKNSLEDGGNRMPIMISTDTSEFHSDPTKMLNDKNKNSGKATSTNRNSDKKSKHLSPYKQVTTRSSNCNSPVNRKSTQTKERCNKNKPNNIKNSHPTSRPCCPICSKEYTAPILLSCGHTFCKECVSVFVEASDGCSFSCPVCEFEIILQGEEEELFCPNFMILKQMEVDDEEGGLLCSACESENEAAYVCVQCSDLLCEDCADAHRIVKYTRDHVVKEITCDTNISKYIKKRYYCNDHENEQLDIYCERCQKSICRECALESHRGEKHNCIPLKLAAQTCREETQRQLYDVKSHSPNLQLTLMELKSEKKKLRDQANITYAEISESFRRITTVLKEHERKLYKTLEDTYRKKLRVLKSEKEKVIIRLERFEVVSSMLQNLENHDDDVEVLQMKSTIKEASDNLLNLPAESKLNINNTAVLFKSNELMIKEALKHHGDIIKLKTEESLNGKLGTKNEDKLSIVCDFSDHSNSNNEEDEGNNNSQTSSLDNDVSLRCDAKKLRAKSNWRIVRSRIYEISKKGDTNDNVCNGGARKPVGVKPSMPHRKKEEISEARKEKARANWLILRSHLNEVTPSLKKQKQMQHQQQQSSKRSKQSLPSTTKKIKQVKAMRYRAIRERAIANWLLVRSKIPEIIIYGRVSGRLFTLFTQTRQRTTSTTSPTILKLKYFRAKTLRARANWLLVASRLSDIAAYPKRKKSSSEDQMSWDHYRTRLETQRERASRNKYVAGKLRGQTNWLIVKSRIPDVILFGKYQHYKNLEKTNKQGRGRTPSPGKYSSVYSNSDAKFAACSSSCRPTSRSTCRPESRSSKDKNKMCSKHKGNALKNWENLIRKTNPKSRGTDHHNKKGTSQNRRSASEPGGIRNNSKNAKDNWRKLIHKTLPKSSKQNNHLEMKHWHSLINGTQPGKNVNTNKKLNTLMNGTNPKNKKQTTHTNWDTLITGTSVKNEQAGLRNWNSLISGTQMDNKSNKSLNNWDKLINDTSVKKEIDGLTNWRKLINETPTNVKGKKDMINHSLIKRKTNTETYASKPGSRDTDSITNWFSLINVVQASNASSNNIKSKAKELEKKKNNDINNKWHTLITGTRPSGATNKSKRVTEQHVKSSTYGKNNGTKNGIKNGDINGAHHEFGHWDKLLNGTKSGSSRDFKDGISGTSIDSETDSKVSSERHWHQLTHSSRYEKRDAEKNWDKLLNITFKEKDEAHKNWQQLITGTKSKTKHPNERAREHWHKVRDSLARLEDERARPISADEMKRKNKEAAYRNWGKLISAIKTPKIVNEKYNYTSNQNNNNNKNNNEVVKKAVRNWNALVSGTEIKASPYQNWTSLLQGTDASRNSSAKKTALENWQRLQSGDVLNEKQVDKNWSQLVCGTGITEQEKAKTHWHHLLNSVPVDRKALAEKHWVHLITMSTDPPASKKKEIVMKNWEALLEGRVRKPPEVLINHWQRLIRDTNQYKPINGTKEPPPGIKILYDPGNPTKLQQPNIVRLNIKNKKGDFKEVHLKMTSPDKSILSAHVQQNNDGTYTIFCCPSVQKSFNISISLGGDKFKKDRNVFNIKGSFANLKDKEEVLAQRTIGLIRWHLTPGLLVQKDGKIVANTDY